MRVQFFYRLIWVYVSVIFQFRFTPLAYDGYFDGIYHFVHAKCCSALPKKTSNAQCSMNYLISRIGLSWQTRNSRQLGAKPTAVLHLERLEKAQTKEEKPHPSRS